VLFALLRSRQCAAERPLADSAGSPREADRLLKHTVGYWRNWLRRSRYLGRYREMVERSALVLKLLVYQPTAALDAAPTTSLPEFAGGGRNWDYRHTWIRDAAFTLYGLMCLGFTDEAAARRRDLGERRRLVPLHVLGPDDVGGVPAGDTDRPPSAGLPAPSLTGGT
jgi:Glycosyl hydrolases family 15